MYVDFDAFQIFFLREEENKELLHLLGISEKLE